MRRLFTLLTLIIIAIAAWQILRDLDIAQPSEGTTDRRVRRFAQRSPEGEPDSAQRRVVAPIASPGAALTIELIEPPAAWYGRHEWTEADRKYASIIEELGVVYDPALGHAARELAHLYSVEDGLIPGEALDWLLLSGGAADWGVRQSFTATSNDGDEAIRERVTALALAEPQDRRPIRVGVGEAYEMGAVPPRTIAVLLSRNELRLGPMPRAVKPGAKIVLTAELPPEATAPHVLVMGPDLEVRDIDATPVGQRIAVPIDAGLEPGLLWIELLATMPNGPTPLTQVVVHVGEEPSSVWTGRYPPDESRVSTPDMARNGFFGHVSPTTGSVGDRLADAGVRAISYAENIARNSSLWSAEAGLLRSLGHRKNILSPRSTHVGVAAVPANEDGRRVWLVTQVFSRPVKSIDPAEARERVLDRIDEVREAAGLSPLLEDGRVREVADAEAKSGKPDVHSALERADGAGLTRRGAYAWVHRVSELSDVEIPKQAGDSRYKRVGVGVHQDLDAPGGATVTVVVILAG
jgi:hypothetical protein